MPGHWPSFVNTSLWQTPQASPLTRTCPASGLGISRSTISKSAPGLGTCAAFIAAIPTFVVAINPPMDVQIVERHLGATVALGTIPIEIAVAREIHPQIRPQLTW